MIKQFIAFLGLLFLWGCDFPKVVPNNQLDTISVSTQAYPDSLKWIGSPEQVPEFPGGLTELGFFLTNNLHRPSNWT